MLSIGLLQDHSILKKTHEGWKLLLSIDPECVAEARDLVLAVTNRYGCCCPWGLSAKQSGHIVIRLKRPGLEISRFGDTAEVYVLPSDAKRIVLEITSVLSQHKINPGEKWEAYAETISPYFSLRNDNLTIPPSYRQPLGEDYGLLLEEKGANFNPVNIQNPYHDLLPSRPFDLAEHFCSLPFSSKKEVLVNLRLSMVAYLREYTYLDTLDESETSQFEQQCFLYGESVQVTFLKADYVPYLNDIKMAMMLLRWSFCPEAESAELNFQHSPCSESFICFIEKYNERLHSIPLLTREIRTSYAAFEELMKHKRVDGLIQHAHQAFEQEKNSASFRVLIDEMKKLVRSNDYYQSQAALKKMKEVLDVGDYYHTLLTIDRNPLVQMELADIFINNYGELGHDRPITYKALTYLKRAVSVQPVEPQVEQSMLEKINKFWAALKDTSVEKTKSFWGMSQRGEILLINLLRELAKKGNRIAMFAMACFLCDDGHNDAMDHEEAMSYFLDILADEMTSVHMRLSAGDRLSALLSQTGILKRKGQAL